MEYAETANELASYPEKALLDESAIAAMFQVSTRTVKRWVSKGELPSPARMGGRKFWFAGRILAHIEQRVSESEKTAAQRNSAAMRAETP